MKKLNRYLGSLVYQVKDIPTLLIPKSIMRFSKQPYNISSPRLK